MGIEIGIFLSFSATEFQVDVTTIQEETQFRQLDGWSSLNALIFISNIHDKFNVLISSSDLATLTTFGDIFQLIKDRV